MTFPLLIKPHARETQPECLDRAHTEPQAMTCTRHYSEPGGLPACRAGPPPSTLLLQRAASAKAARQLYPIPMCTPCRGCHCWWPPCPSPTP